MNEKLIFWLIPAIIHPLAQIDNLSKSGQILFELCLVILRNKRNVQSGLLFVLADC